MSPEEEQKLYTAVAEAGDLAMFGMTKHKGKWIPILRKRCEDESIQCKKCKGHGTYGNPFAGALYTCEVCKGEGSIVEGLKIEQSIDDIGHPFRKDPEDIEYEGIKHDPAWEMTKTAIIGILLIIPLSAILYLVLS